MGKDESTRDAEHLDFVVTGKGVAISIASSSIKIVNTS